MGKKLPILVLAPILIALCVGNGRIAHGAPACGTAPKVYATRYFQSPVRADPDDLLLLPGYGFENGATVAYRLHDTGTPPPIPPHVPSINTADAGRLDVIYTNVPDSLTVRLPGVINKGRVYALWVKNPAGCWSSPVLINNARPLWLTPDIGYETQALATLPRELKIVGRNLDAAPSVNGGTGRVWVRLTGPATYLLAAEPVSPTLDHYQAKVTLPPRMVSGRYYAEVSRDQKNWVSSPDNVLTILPDPRRKSVFHVSVYGGCRADDGQDDTGCIVGAIAAAAASGEGEVHFAPGRWDIINPAHAPRSAEHGIVVPAGVDLVGDGAHATTVTKSGQWNMETLFTLQGRQTVRGIHFTDTLAIPTETSFLRLGRFVWRAPNDPAEIEGVTIVENRFTGMANAIGNAARPIRHLAIVRNILHAYKDDIHLGGDPNLKNIRFNVRDSVIAYNTFLSGRYVDAKLMQGVIASNVGASLRLDFSHNVADGRIGGGWRAAHFFHMNNNHEMLLVSRNHSYCTGDKAGDGEAIVFDNNHNDTGFANKAGFAEMRNVISASANAVSVNGAWQEKTPNYYNEHWVQVVDGPGVGQARKIVAYTSGPSPVITVTPPWDVVPVPHKSRITVAKVFWNTHIVDNVVDIRPCKKSNVTKPQSGIVGWYAMTLDSTIEGNALYDTNGIIAATSYGWFNYANEIRNNIIDGEYRFPSSIGGISLWYNSLPDAPSPLSGYGLSISHNTIVNADTARPGEVNPTRSGAIGFYRTWHGSRLTPYQWKATLVFHNHFANVNTGIYVEQAPTTDDRYVWNSVFYGNTLENVKTAIKGKGGTNTMRLGAN